jgi:cell division protein FtsB
MIHINSKGFWALIVVLLFGFSLHGFISYEAVSQNHERITKLEKERDVTLLKLAKESQETANRVVDALTGLTTVIAERSRNDARVLHLLETISAKLNGEKHGPQE